MQPTTASPFFPRNTYSDLPIEIHSQILQELGALDLASLMCTCKGIEVDSIFNKFYLDEKRKFIDARLAGVLQGVVEIPFEKCVEMVKVLQTFKQEWDETVFEKDAVERKKLTLEFLPLLKEDRCAIGSEFLKHSYTQIDAGHEVTEDEKFENKKNLAINQFKILIIKHEQLLAEQKQAEHFSFNDFEFQRMLNKEVEDQFFAWSCSPDFYGNHGLDFKHQVEDAASFFAADPKKMQAFMQERHKHDYALRDKWINASSFQPTKSKKSVSEFCSIS